MATSMVKKILAFEAWLFIFFLNSMHGSSLFLNQSAVRRWSPPAVKGSWENCRGRCPLVSFVLLRSYVIFIQSGSLQCDIVLISKRSFGCNFFCKLLVSRSKSCSVGYIIFTQNVSLVIKGYYFIRWPYYNIFVYSALHWTKVPRR